jgi:hypothetical protein
LVHKGRVLFEADRIVEDANGSATEPMLVVCTTKATASPSTVTLGAAIELIKANIGLPQGLHGRAAVEQACGDLQLAVPSGAPLKNSVQSLLEELGLAAAPPDASAPAPPAGDGAAPPKVDARVIKPPGAPAPAPATSVASKPADVDTATMAARKIVAPKSTFPNSVPKSAFPGLFSGTGGGMSLTGSSKPSPPASSLFTFGASPAQTPATAPFTFGAKNPTSPAPTGFGTKPATSPVTAAPFCAGAGFGAASKPALGGFGTGVGAAAQNESTLHLKPAFGAVAKPQAQAQAQASASVAGVAGFAPAAIPSMCSPAPTTLPPVDKPAQFTVRTDGCLVTTAGHVHRCAAFTCDGCGAGLPAGAKVHGCRKDDDWDLCTTCVASLTPQQVANSAFDLGALQQQEALPKSVAPVAVPCSLETGVRWRSLVPPAEEVAEGVAATDGGLAPAAPELRSLSLSEIVSAVRAALGAVKRH